MKTSTDGTNERRRDCVIAQKYIGFRLVVNVIFSEALPAIISGIILATISILGATAMAGTMGAGGIGSAAITYGYQSFNGL